MTNVANGVCTPVNASDIANFYKGMILVASANNGTSVSHTLLPSNVAQAKAYVLSVDRDAGTFVVADTAGSTTPEIPAGWGAQGTNVFVFPLGQFKPLLPGSGIGSKLLCHTLADWITPTVASDTFNTVDRSADSALSGVRVPASLIAALPPEHKIGFASTYMQSRYAGSRPLTFVAQSEQWFAIVRALHAQGMVSDIGSTLTGGGRAVQVMGVNGMCEIIAEPHQDPTFIYGLDIPEIKIHHLDGLPGVANADGLEMLRQADSNDLEFRLIAFPQLIVREPWLHCRFAV